jgi:sterol desaturase/sphingolipid hydroxylase (fatty acid hydroxylase superfamily)
LPWRLRSVYRLVHKHHHRQHAPSRGNTDAVNVHPFEFVVGEYIHLLAVLLVGTALGGLHLAAVLAFIVAGGVAASLNHTRLGVTLPLGLYDVRAHDVHHRLPKSNYGQYTMAWDHIFGTFREYSNAPQSPGPSPMKAE